MKARNINGLQALLEYAHSLPWGGHENNVASRYLDGALDMMDESMDRIDAEIDADINADVAPGAIIGVGQK